MTRATRLGGSRTPRDPAAARLHKWLRGLRKGRDMRYRGNREAVRRASEIVEGLGPEPSAVALDLVERYLDSVALVARLEAAARADATIDLTPLLRASEKLLKQAQALALLPPKLSPAPPASSIEVEIRTSFAAAMSAQTSVVPGKSEDQRAAEAPPPPAALPAPPRPPPSRAPALVIDTAPPLRDVKDVTPKPAPIPRLVETREMKDMPAATQKMYELIDARDEGTVASRMKRDLTGL